VNVRRTLRLVRHTVPAAAAILMILGIVPASSARATPADFVTRQGTNLYLNGQPYLFTGINMYTANLRNNCISGYSGGYNNSVLDNDLNQFDSATGGKSRVIRAWFFQSLATTNGVRDWSAFDHTLAVAKSHGFKVIAVLANAWGACEAAGASGPNRLGYRDISFYQGGYKQAPDVGHIGGPSEGGITSYRQWVSDVVSRYANDPTIFAWQLMNEANAGTFEASIGNHYYCPDEKAAYDAILSWATDMTTLVKSIDPNHLLNIGTLDRTCGVTPPQDIAISAIAGNDLCDYHDYYSSPGTTMPPDLSYMIAECKLIGRPVIVDEMGIDLTDPVINGNFTTRAADMEAKITAEFQAGVSAILPWVWNGGSQSIDKRYQIKPGDPVLATLGQFGMSSPTPGPSPSDSASTASPEPSGSASPTIWPAIVQGPAAPSNALAMTAPDSSGQNASANAPAQVGANTASSAAASDISWAYTVLPGKILRVARVAVGTFTEFVAAASPS
jgi:hypothetical protein